MRGLRGRAHVGRVNQHARGEDDNRDSRTLPSRRRTDMHVKVAGRAALEAHRLEVALGVAAGHREGVDPGHVAVLCLWKP